MRKIVLGLAALFFCVIAFPASAAPIADAGADREGFAGQATWFNQGNSSGEGSLTYFWDFGDTKTSTVANTYNIYRQIGTYVATLTVTDSTGESAQDSAVITITSSTPPPKVYAGVDYSIHEGEQVCTSGEASTTVGIMNRAWQMHDGTMVENYAWCHIYQTSGTYTETFIATDYYGQTASDTMTVTVAPFNEAPVAVPGEQQFGLPGAAMTFDGSASSDPDGSVVLYNWDFGDGTSVSSSDPVVSHTYADYGYYFVYLQVVDNEGLASESVPVSAVVQRDEVTITSATWSKSKKELTVVAKSDYPDVTLTVKDIGVMTYNAANYTYTLIKKLATKPSSVTVTSSQGGSAWASVK